MNRKATVITGSAMTAGSLAFVAGLMAFALAGCTAAAETVAAEPESASVENVVTVGTGADAETTAIPEPTRTPRHPLQAHAWEIGCEDFVAVGGYAGAPRPSDRPDLGALPHASGAVTYNPDGTAATYTVAAGDAGTSIGERFCVDHVTLQIANDAWPMLTPGDVLIINP